MLSVLEVKRRLPDEFVENLYELYSPGTVDKILAGMSGERSTTIRVNTLKTTILELMKNLKEEAIKFNRVLWYENALEIINANEKQLQKLLNYENGEFYLQSLSSMVPPLVLEPKQNEKVLDLTAAPGSKTTQMSMMMQNKGYILANELDKIRCERLKYNVKMQGTKIVEVKNGRGEKIGEQYPEFFDKVLLDAPCSGEGRFLANQVGTYRNWSIKTVKQCAKIQKKLIKSAYQALKTNGIMVYSTCTLNKEENEEILQWAIENMNLQMLDISIKIPNTLKAFGDKNIEKAIRMLPSKSQEGFFVAKLRKRG